MSATLLPQCAPEETTDSPAVKERIGKMWSMIPIIAGAPFPVVAYSGDWTEAVFGAHYAASIPFRCILVVMAIIFMSSAVPTFCISVIAESRAVESMLQAVHSFDPAFRTTFLQELSSIKQTSLLHACCLTIVYGAFGWMATRTMYGVLLLGVGGGAFSLTSGAQTAFLQLLVQLCHKDIDAFIAQYLPESSPEDGVSDTERGVDWQDAAAAHYELDLRLEDLWAPTLGSMLICPLLARHCATGGLMLVFGIVQKNWNLKVAVWAVGAGLMVAGIQTLRGPAGITTRCNDTSPRLGRRAIKAAVNSMTCRLQMTEQQEVTHVKFLNYLNSTTVGVELFGVMVTPSLVVHALIAMGTNLPIAVGILEGLMK